jgi:PIN domain nuclease of toxin-antitoxin system
MESLRTVIVLDTNAWLFWLHDPQRLTKPARLAVTRAIAADRVLVSVISLWEIALKVQIGKLVLPLDLDTWWAKAAEYPGMSIEPLNSLDALSSTRLPGDFHRDPADRFIVALARRRGAQLVTSDEKIIAYPHVETVW